jgi:hypothetical protein
MTPSGIEKITLYADDKVSIAKSEDELQNAGKY